MSDTWMDRRWRKGDLLWILIGWALVGLCCAGHRPNRRAEGPHHNQHHGVLGQRNDYQAAQRTEYLSLNNHGQVIQYPSVSDAGSQLQKCAPGFYREGNSLFFGRCVPCECNGLADECEDGTGRCLDCKDNTAGDRCERCKEGYYGSAAQGTCRLCPCPFTVSSSSFAVSCGEVSGDIQCVCKPGYTGVRCESCAPGYYGDPLIPGRDCQPCNCNGNGNSCDPKTGVCKNSLEPGDTNTDEHCQECDNCAQTLLNDLEKLDSELAKIKAQLDNTSVSGALKERLDKLEKAVSDTKILVNKFSSTINTQKSKVDGLEEDTDNLADDIKSLKDKADKNAGEADEAVEDVEESYKRAKDLETEIEKMMKKIIDLLKQLKNDGPDDSLPENSLTEMLKKAQEMLAEMKNRNFTSQKTAAEKERDEAIKLLDYVKNNVSKQCDQNEAAAEKIRSQMKDYNAKLKELEKALETARDLVTKANTQNGLNDLTLNTLKKRIEDLEKERKTVKIQIALAEDELKKTEDSVKMLLDNKTDFEQLAAQLDGAKTDLTKKVNELTKAVAKKDIVEEAEEQAKNLTKLAKELEEAVKNASGRSEVRDAKDAIEAYENITRAINAAEAAAKEAQDAADSALNNINKEKLTDKAKDLKKKSNELLKQGKDSEKELQDSSTELDDLKNRLAKAKEKKNNLEKSLLDFQREIGDINRDEIGNMIDEAKKKAASASNTAANTMERLNDIRKEIGKISVTPVNANLSKTLKDVDATVKDLLNTIPSLNDKISEVENLTSEFSSARNISENIKKIKELIELARDAANKIVVPMSFTGEGHVELRPPKNLDDLKAYTTMSLSLQRSNSRGDGRRRRRQVADKGDMFVLYLGQRDSSKNYIGMVLRNNRLYGLYKLNGQEYEMESGFISISDDNPATFDKVDLHRIYQDAELNLTNDITSGKSSEPIQKTRQGSGNKYLLDLSPDDVVFYVGGYPSNFQPPPSMSLPKYTGCIEFNSFNSKAVSLYNFQKAEKINAKTPCKRLSAAKGPDYYEGSGYSRVLLAQTLNKFEMMIFTRSENALLFYIGDEDNYLMVTIEKGFLVMRNGQSSEPTVADEKMFPMDKWFTFRMFIRETVFLPLNKGKLGVKNQGYNFNSYKDLYIGGLPQGLRERWNITTQPFKGCLKTLKINDLFRLPDEQVGISRQCKEDSLGSFKGQFNLNSSLTGELQGFSLDNDVTLSLGFKSTETQGIILQDKQQANQINLSMEDGHLILHFNDKRWKSNKKYNDGNWHYVTATKSGGRITLQVDDEDRGTEDSGTTTIPDIPNTYGSVLLGNKFEGCISNFYTRRPDNLYKPEDLSRFQNLGDVLIDVCTASKPAQLIMDSLTRKR